MICTVSGPVKNIAGQLLPKAKVKVWRREVVGQDGAMVMPNQSAAVVDADGILTLEIYPGEYLGVATDALGCPVEFTLSVPDAATAYLADCLEQSPPITPSLVAEVRQIKTDVQQIVATEVEPAVSAAEGHAQTASGFADAAGQSAQDAAGAAGDAAGAAGAAGESATQAAGERGAAEVAALAAQAAKSGAEAARDAAASSSLVNRGWVANAASLSGITTPALNDRAMTLDNEHVHRWDGSAWVDEGPSPLATKVPRSALKATVSLQGPGDLTASDWENPVEEIFGLPVAVAKGVTDVTRLFYEGDKGFAILPSVGGGFSDALGTPADNNNDPVLVAKDWSDLKTSIQAPAAANRPTLKVSGNGRYWEFNGTNSRLDVPTGATPTGPFTITCSMRKRSGGTAATIFGSSGSTSAGIFAGFSTGSTLRLAIAGGTAGTVSATVPSSYVVENTRRTVTFQYTGAEVLVFLDGVEVARQAATGTYGAVVSPSICYSNSTVKSPIDLFGMIVLDRAVSTEERMLMERLVEIGDVTQNISVSNLVEKAKEEVAENTFASNGAMLALPGTAAPKGWRRTEASILGLDVLVSNRLPDIDFAFEGGEKGWALFAEGSQKYSDPSKQTSADSSGELVSVISDVSGNNVSISTHSGGTRPEIVDGIDGRCLRFDGVADRMQYPLSTINNTGVSFVCSIALRFADLASPDDQYYPQVLGDTSLTAGLSCGFGTNARPRFSMGGKTPLQASVSAKVDRRITLSYIYDGANAVIYMDGEEIARSAVTGAFTMGAQPLMCYAGVNTVKSPIDLFGAVLVGRAVTNAERKKLEDAVSGKLAVSGVKDQVERAQQDFVSLISEEVGNLYGLTPVTTTYAYSIGDSTIASYLGEPAVLSLVDTVRQREDVSVPGHTINQQLAAWNNLSIDPGKVGWVIAQIGLNDLDPVESASTALSRLQNLVDTVRASIGPSKKLLIGQMIPCRARLISVHGATNGPIAYAKWQAMNEAIAGLGPTPITGVDGRVTSHVSALNDGNGNLAAPFDTGDGIHENELGRQIIAGAWEDALQSVGVRP